LALFFQINLNFLTNLPHFVALSAPFGSIFDFSDVVLLFAF